MAGERNGAETERTDLACSLAPILLRVCNYFRKTKSNNIFKDTLKDVLQLAKNQTYTGYRNTFQEQSHVSFVGQRNVH